MAEIATVASKEVAAVGGSPVMGIEGVDDKDLKIGNLVLVQELSKPFRKVGLNPGEFANGVTMKKVENLSFVPAFMTKLYHLYDQSGAMAKWILSSKDENDAQFAGKRRRQEGNLKAEIVPALVVVAVMDGRPMKISFKNMSGYPCGQKLYTFARESKKALWETQYILSSREAKNKAGIEYFSMDVAPQGASSTDDMALAQQLYQSFRATELQMDSDAQEPGF